MQETDDVVMQKMDELEAQRLEGVQVGDKLPPPNKQTNPVLKNRFTKVIFL